METDEGDLDTLEDVTEATVVKRPEVTIHIEYTFHLDKLMLMSGWWEPTSRNSSR